MKPGDLVRIKHNCPDGSYKFGDVGLILSGERRGGLRDVMINSDIYFLYDSEMELFDHAPVQEGAPYGMIGS